MDYYEELGIQRDATAAEIREAYKLAARLLHPDLQRDRRLQHLAECQMRRLSDVAATLQNPRERARYDAALAIAPRTGRFPLHAAGPASQLCHRAARHWFWIVMGAMSMGMWVWVWYGSARRAEAVPRIAAAEMAPTPGKAPQRRSSTKTSPRRLRPAASTRVRDVDARLPSRLTVGVTSEPGWIPPPPLPDAVLSESPNTQSAVPPVLAPHPSEVVMAGVESYFDGRWLLSADAGGRAPAGTYPARYVEFVLRGERGRLAGEYRAVYSRLDKAISPEVLFKVQGPLPQGSSGLLKWESKTGARGELELILQGPNRLRVKWWTTQFGRQEVLGSGMADLMRLTVP